MVNIRFFEAGPAGLMGVAKQLHEMSAMGRRQTALVVESKHWGSVDSSLSHSMMDVRSDPNWKLYARALDILEGRSTGHALPILRKLARRRFAPAITILSDYVSIAEAIQRLRSAARRGDAASAYNLAITHRNRGDILGYRTALARAAKLDPDAADELRRFKLRFPHDIMRRFRRLEPDCR